jgi:hypothetical protein
MAQARSLRQLASSRRHAATRLRALATAGRSRLGGFQYWQAGGSTRAAAKRAKRR